MIFGDFEENKDMRELGIDAEEETIGRKEVIEIFVGDTEEWKGVQRKYETLKDELEEK